MKNLRYIGSSDVRELSTEDLRRLGVEDAQAALRFERGHSMTVSDEVAEAILSQVNDMREATDTELVEEETDLEAELGFALYDPNEYNVEEVQAELATSSEDRRKYILDQERAGKNRKTVFEAVGAEYDESPEPAQEPGAEIADEMAAAGGEIQRTTGAGGTPPPKGRASTA
jgi:hypothetical protein